MRRSSLSYAFLISFLSTIFLLQWDSQPHYPAALWISLAILGLLILLSSKKSSSALAIAGIAGMTIAFTSVARTTHVTTSSDIESHAAQFVTIHGTVCNEPDKRTTQTFYTICAKSIEAGTGTFAVRGNVLISDRRRIFHPAYGDSISVNGTLRKPPYVPSFDYAKYLSLSEIYSVLSAKEFRADGAWQGNVIKAALFRIRERFEGRVEELFPEPHASFLEGLLTGAKRGIPQELMDEFNATGLSHIVAISGYNITIVLAFVSSLLFWLPLRWRFVPSLVSLVAFVILTGASASVVRAGIMGTMGLLAVQTGRKQEMRLTILWTLFVMLTLNPKHLWWDASFQLSFLAVVGIAELQPILKRLCAPLPAIFGIRDGMQVTLSAQIFTAPWIVLLFQRLSLISPLSNITVLPLIPPAMLLGFVSVMLSFVSPPLGQRIATAAWGILDLILRIIGGFARLPFAAIPLEISHAQIAACYVFIALAVALWHFTIGRGTRLSSLFHAKRAQRP